MNQIPKKLHFCWFGGNEYNDKIKMCIESWKKYVPDYEIIEWNESNFDINSIPYVKEAYQAKKYAFVSDYVRLYALYHYGGIYCDTDLEIINNIDDFLKYEGFSSFEAKDSVPTAIMGSIAKTKIMKELLDYYNDKHFILEDGSYDMTTNVTIITNIFLSKGLKLNGKKQTIEHYTFFPQSYFAPNKFCMIFGIKPKKSYSIHHFNASWNSKSKKDNLLKRYLVGKTRNLFGTIFCANLSKGIKNIWKK